MGRPSRKKGPTSNKKQKRLTLIKAVDIDTEDELRGGGEWFPVFVSGFVLVIALLVRFWVTSGDDNNSVSSPNQDPAVHSFLTTFVCDSPRGYCHDSLEPTRRTQRATKDIEAGEHVLSVPRELQIWDLDALRDPFISEKLSKTIRNWRTGHPIDSGAYLAVYLVRRHRIAKHDKNKTSVDPMLPYLDILPTFDDLQSTHPLASERDKETAEKFGEYSSAFLTFQGYRAMIVSEYESFVYSFEDVSEFTSEVSEEEYVAMRVNVLSRSFGTGPLGPEQSQNYKNDKGMSIEEEIQLYKEERGIDLSLGCKAMVPVLDMYDHHAKPNVEWRFHSESGSFEIHAGPDGIQAGYEVMDSYGTFTDSHLIAKFGFVNADGSDYTEAKLAAHRLYDAGLKHQFSFIPVSGPTEEMQKEHLNVMVEYLLHDDGYRDCIQETKSNLDTMHLKHLKIKHLLKIANKRDRWIITLPPRNINSRPGKSTENPIVHGGFPVDNANLSLDIRKQLATCRLIQLHENDFNGQAIRILSDVLANNTAEDFFIEELNPAHEYRSYKCLERLAMYGGNRLGSGGIGHVVNDLLSVEDLYKTKYSDWAAAQVRLGELQTLHAFQNSCNKAAANIIGKVPKEDREKEEFFVRETPCPKEYSLFLL